MWDLLLIGLTVLLFLLPLTPALREWWLRHDITPLEIIQGHEGHTRHFSDTFRIFIQAEISALNGHAHPTEPAENYCLIKEGNLFTPTEEERQNQSTQRVVLAYGTLSLPEDFTFPREVYGKQTVIGLGRNHFKAVLAEDMLLFGKHSTVLRWAHGRMIQADPDCNFMGRISATEEITLATGCAFTRLHAPCVKFGMGVFLPPDARVKENAPVGIHKPILNLLEPDIDTDNRLISQEDFEFPENGIFCGNIVVRRNVLIRRGAEIIGSVKANGTLRIETGVSITGSLISSKQLVIAQACIVGGPVVSEQSISVDTGVVIGMTTKPTTLTAPAIHITCGSVIYGTVWARHQGLVLSAGEIP